MKQFKLTKLQKEDLNKVKGGIRPQDQQTAHQLPFNPPTAGMIVPIDPPTTGIIAPIDPKILHK